jgi:hypothetical protein
MDLEEILFGDTIKENPEIIIASVIKSFWRVK